MANITDAGAAMIAAHVGADFDSLTDGQITAALNEPDTPNPAPQGNVPRLMKMGELMGLAGTATRAALLGNPNLPTARADVLAQDHVGVATWLAAYASVGTIPQGEYDAMMDYVMTPVPDPSWQAQVSWAVLNLGRAVDAEDVATARAVYEEAE
jgi:hypothetical protein